MIEPWLDPAQHEHIAATWANDVGKRGTPEWNAAYDKNLSDIRAHAAQAQESVPSHMNEQQFGPFYHGTPRARQPGDTIDPGQQSMSSMTRAGYTYMTHSPSNAAQYSRGGNNRRLRDPSASGHVYEVEPTGEYGQDPGSPDSYRSKSPLRIKREIPVDKARKTSVNYFNNHGPGYVGKDAEYDNDMDSFDRKWYGS